MSKSSWKSDLKRARQEIHPSPDSISDYSPMRGCVRLDQGRQIFDRSFRPDRTSPFRFVPVNSINPDAKKENTSKAFQFSFGN